MPKDNFSKQAKLYAQFRPHYPYNLYQFIYKHTNNFEAAWDCATGNGQVAQELSKRFKTVYATDISQEQLNHAVKKENILYSIGSAEQSALGKKVDLITVAQALHWFDFKAFYKEVERVAKPGATLTYWAYGLPEINKEIDSRIRHFHNETIGAYWDPERKLWANRYESINFPLKELQKRVFEYKILWELKHLAGYLTSWSSVQKYIHRNAKNPVDDFIEELRPFWNRALDVRFPIFLTLGIIS